MAITNTAELTLAVADFLNREDLGPAMESLIDTAQDRILYDPRFRGELTEKVIKKPRSIYDTVNPLRVASFWSEEEERELSDEIKYRIDEDTGNVTSYFEPYDPETHLDMEIIRLYVDDVEFTKVPDYSEVLNAGPNENIYCEVGGKYYLSGWLIEDTPTKFGTVNPVFTFVANEKPRLKETLTTDTLTGSSSVGITSTLLKQQPNVFLYATLVEAAIYLRDSEFVQVYQARYEELMDKLAKDWKRKQVSSGFNVASVGSDKRI